MKNEYAKRLGNIMREQEKQVAGARKYLEGRKGQDNEKILDNARKQKWANRVVDRRLAMSNPAQFLRDVFYDENGVDEGGPPITPSNLCAADRVHLHNTSGRLFHQTSVDGTMVIGSSRNNLGQQLVKRLDEAAGWSTPQSCHA